MRTKDVPLSHRRRGVDSTVLNFIAPIAGLPIQRAETPCVSRTIEVRLQNTQIGMLSEMELLVPDVYDFSPLV